TLRAPLRKVLLFLLLASGPVVSAPAQMSVSLLPDGVSLAGGAILALASEGFHPSMQEMPVNIDMVNGFDRLAMFGYSRGFDVASDVLQYTAVALPLTLAFGIGQDQAIAAGVIYIEVMSRALFAKNTGKFLFPRVRPWVYLAPETGSVPETWEGNDSFPSGHATMTFAAAAFGITVAVLDLPSGSPWLVPFIATEASLAVLTGTFRVVSGMHFMTDVIAGAAIGTLIGIALPLVHTSMTGGTIGQPRALRVDVPLLALAL
ncbi:MAG: phosphatase PAP2 family protein, partial [Spirochaetia bacterium]